jgi:bifunctional UDP-N-acetylglucosamine pyrophosphorylase / glucosamine-1-phosphate N-acetyltransferase
MANPSGLWHSGFLFQAGTMKASLPVNAVILAAGKGSRMKSTLPKVLLPVGGVPILSRVVATLKKIPVQEIGVILGNDLLPFDSFLKENNDLTVCIQESQKGTGDAAATIGHALQGVKMPPYNAGRLYRGGFKKSNPVLIAAGDCPFLDPLVLGDFVRQCLDRKAGMGLIAMEASDPTGYGRVIVDAKGQLVKIVEQRDASPEELRVKLCNTGVLFAETGLLFDLLSRLEANNAQKEFYITDCFELCIQSKLPVHVFQTTNYASFQGINDRQQLDEANKQATK